MHASDQVPRNLELLKASQCLRISWQQGAVTDISFHQLRRFCACAFCRAQGSVGKAELAGSSEVTGIHLMGSSGLQICFSDGHDRGIFPWGYLWAIAEGKGWEHFSETG